MTTRKSRWKLLAKTLQQKALLGSNLWLSRISLSKTWSVSMAYSSLLLKLNWFSRRNTVWITKKRMRGEWRPCCKKIKYIMKAITKICFSILSLKSTLLILGGELNLNAQVSSKLWLQSLSSSIYETCTTHLNSFHNSMYLEEWFALARVVTTSGFSDAFW